MTKETNRRGMLLIALALSCAICSCSSRYTKQYKCQIAGKSEPRTAYEYVERGVEHIHADEFDCALQACSEAIRLDSRLSTGYACRGGVLSNQGEYLRALKDFDQALSLQPENGDFYYSRAQVNDRLEHTDLTLKDLDKAVELIKSQFGRSVAFALRGRIYSKQGRHDESIGDYSKAIDLAPEFAYHWANRGEVYFNRKEYQKAISDYSEAIKLDEKNVYFRSNRAKAYRALGQEELAQQDANEAARLEKQ
jgi:tetratricopeptide (TPR) repeat protein